jgi:hypothetical protein
MRRFTPFESGSQQPCQRRILRGAQRLGALLLLKLLLLPAATANPLAGLPALSKTHHSYGMCRPGPGGNTAARVMPWEACAFPVDSDSPLQQDFARITHAWAIDLAFNAGGRFPHTAAGEPIWSQAVFDASQNKVSNAVLAAALPAVCAPSLTLRWLQTEVIEATKLCAKSNASLSINYSPWQLVWGSSSLYCPTGSSNCDPTIRGVGEELELRFFRNRMANISAWIAETNAQLGSSVRIGAVLLDMECFLINWDNETQLQALARKSDLIYNASREFCDASTGCNVEQYNRGTINQEKTMAKPAEGIPADDAWTPWPGYPACLGLGDTFATSLYTVPEYEATRESYRRTVANALKCNVSFVTPWVWLGGGERRRINPTHDADTGGDSTWDYDVAYSWMIGKEIADPFYAKHPARFAPWNRARVVALYPNPLDSSAWTVAPVINHSTGAAVGGDVLSSVTLKHFVAYVKGAAGIRINTTGAGVKTDDAWSGPRMRSARIGASPVRHFLVGEAATAVWPLWFSANGQTGMAASGKAPTAAWLKALENIYTQVSLAAASGVKLFTVVLTMADYLEHGGKLSPDAVSMLHKIVELAPDGYVILRMSFEGGATLGMEKNTIMSATNGSTMLCGCSWAGVDGRGGGGPNGTDDCASPTAAWATAAASQLKKLLCAADAAIPHKIAGVQFVGLSTGEWELPHDDFVYTNGTFDYFPAYGQQMRREWCESRGEPAGCHVPTAAERDLPDIGNSFLTTANGSSAVEFANFTAMKVASTVATLCEAAKEVSGGKLFTSAFYGYIINSAVNIQFAGHAAAQFLLNHESIDAIDSPILYSAAGRSPTGAVLTHGPWNTPALQDKMWIVESDLRTVLADGADEQAYRFDTASLNTTCDVLTRYVFTTFMNGNGMYAFDLSNRGWFGRPGNQSTGKEIWQCMATARDALQRIVGTSAPQKLVQQRNAETFLFLDESSTLHWPVSGPLDNTTPEERTARKEWIHALLQQVMLVVPSLGTPFRIHLMSDLLDKKLDVTHAKLVIFANAYRISDTMRATMRQKLQSEGGSQPTLVFFHAPGSLNGDGEFDPAGPGKLLQSELQMHSEPESLDTVFTTPERAIPNAPDFGTLEGKSYTNLSRYFSTACPGCPTRVGGITPAASRALVSPRFSCSNASTSRCTVLGRSNATGLGSLCFCDHTTHRTLFSASPGIPLPAWRAILFAAGVHVWAPAGVIGCDKTDSISMGAFFDMADISATVGIGIARAAPMLGKSPTELGRVHLPRLATRVTDAISGALVCSQCSSFVDVRLSTSVQAYRFDWQSWSDATIAPVVTPIKIDDATMVTVALAPGPPMRGVDDGYVSFAVDTNISTAPVLKSIVVNSDEEAAAPRAVKTDDDSVERLEPGGWGACLSMARHPINTHLWVSSFDVGGLAFSTDDAKTWSVGCNPDIATLQVFKVLFMGASYDTLLLGTSRGVYIGKHDSRSGAQCPWKLTESNEGLQKVNASQSMKTSHHEFTHPVRVLSVSTAGTVWAGIGIFNTMGPERRDPGQQLGDPFHVYRSDDSGASWVGVLTLPDGGGVESIAAGNDTASAFVSSATGLFVTRDSGSQWMEAGVAPLTWTGDKGRSWHICGRHGAGSPCPFAADKACAGLACLPIAGKGADWNETRPNTRQVVISGGLVFVTIFDVKAHPAANNKPCTFTLTDPNLEHFRGGPWVSDDGGYSFRWLFKAVDGRASYTAARLRCPGISSSYSTTNFPAMAVDPEESTGHVVLGGWGASAQGLTVLRNGTWRYWNDCGANSSAPNGGNLNISTNASLKLGCFEGRRPNTYQRDANMYVFALGVVDWASTERRVITDGVVGHESFDTHTDVTQPLLYLSGFRGAVRGAWDPINHKFSFKQFGDTLVSSPDATPPTWKTNGHGDTCVSDVVWPDGKDPSNFVMAVSDGGLASTKTRGRSWQRMSELWPGALGEVTSKGTAVAADPGSRCIFAAHTNRGSAHILASVLQQCDKDEWKVIGGYQYNGSDLNGMAGAKYIRSLHVLSPAAHGATATVKLLAASDQSFLVFDSAHPAGSQWRNISIPEPCGVGKAVVDLAAGKAWAACGNSVYMLTLHSLQLTRLEMNITSVDSKGRLQPHQLRPHQKLTTLLLWPAAEGVDKTWRIVIGTQYPPQVFDGLLTVSEKSASVAVKQSLDPKDLYNSTAIKSSIELMTVTTIARTHDGTIWLALFVGNYFDGDLPPDIYVSSDGAKSWASYPHKLANTNVRNMVIDPQGKLCMATDGCGLVCVPSKTDDNVLMQILAIGGESNITTAPVASTEVLDVTTQSGWHASAALSSPQANPSGAVTINESAVWAVQSGQPACAKGVGLCFATLGTSGWTDVSFKGTLPPALQAPWGWLGAASLSSSVVVAGGGPLDHEGAALEFDTRTRLWTTLPSMQQRRWGHALVTVGERMFVLGGIYNVNSTLAWQLSSCELLERGASSWVQAPSFPVARMAHAAGVVGNTIIVTGGYCGLHETQGGAPCPHDGIGQSVIKLDTANLATACWQSVRPMLASRFGHAVAVAGNALFALGGGFEDRPSATTPTVEEYDLTLDKWRAAPNMTTPRYQFAATAYAYKISIKL